MTTSAGLHFRWGVLGPGKIAAVFAEDLRLLEDAEIVAVGSRTPGRAAVFAERYGIGSAHDNYEDVVGRDDVDAVYVATVNSTHFDAAMLALKAGKPVLVDKPLTMNGELAERLVTESEQRNVFLMEGMWVRFLPHLLRLRQVVADGAVGALTSVIADHGQALNPQDHRRVFAPELGGGCLLDLGVYPVALASMVLGRPSEVAGVKTMSPTGVESQVSISLRYPSGAQASLHCTSEATTPTTATICGTQGRVDLDSGWCSPSALSLVSRSGTVLERFALNHVGHGIRHEAAEVARCVRAGLQESRIMPRRESLEIMRTLDSVLACAMPRH